tara:strand:+ start:10117 stop:11835 length:1719 start_codon:yes stop_codon:yes gene_type:complete
MPALSKQQQKLFGLALAVKRGDVPKSDVSDEIKDIVKTMPEKDIEKFASTKHKGLPLKKENIIYRNESLGIEIIEHSEPIMFNEAEYQGKKVKLNKVMRGGSKKFYVYVKDGDKVKKVSFGAKGMSIKTKDPERRSNFRARHNCDSPGPKTKARYWSCRMWSGPDAIKNMLKKESELTEKNVPTNPSKWSYYKSQAKKKFDVYPSAYANAWAAKKYKAAGGGWKKESVNEAREITKNIKDIKDGDVIVTGRNKHFKVDYIDPWPAGGRILVGTDVKTGKKGKMKVKFLTPRGNSGLADDTMLQVLDESVNEQLTFQQFQDKAAELHKKLDVFGDLLDEFPKGEMGMVDQTPEVRKIRKKVDIVFKELQNLNKKYVKIYKKELQKARAEKRKKWQTKESVDEDLRKWFGKGGAGGTTKGGWDRYGTDGQKLGKCGDGKKGDAYAACLSAEKARKLGKKGRAAFVKRKRAAQKKAGDSKKGGEQKKGQKPTYAKTGIKKESMDAKKLNKKFLGKRISFKDKEGETWVGKANYIGVNPTHGKLQITVGRTPIWPVDVKSIKIEPKPSGKFRKFER